MGFSSVPSSGSPQLAIAYSDWFLHKPWTRLHPALPLLSWSDDLLLLNRSWTEAQTANADLERLLRPSGLPLKHSFEQCARDLTAGTATTSDPGIRVATSRTSASGIHSSRDPAISRTTGTCSAAGSTSTCRSG